MHAYRPSLLRASAIVVAALLVVVASCARPAARLTKAQERDALYSGLVGRWRGSLQYKDYQDSTRRVTLPTELQVVPSPDRDGLELRYVYDDGPGKTVRSSNHWHFEQTLNAAQWGAVTDSAMQAYQVLTHDGGVRGVPLRLVLEGDGTDNDKPARLRQTIEISPGTFRVRKDVQFAGGGYEFRHEYVFRRAE